MQYPRKNLRLLGSTFCATGAALLMSFGQQVNAAALDQWGTKARTAYELEETCHLGEPDTFGTACRLDDGFQRTSSSVRQIHRTSLAEAHATLDEDGDFLTFPILRAAVDTRSGGSHPLELRAVASAREGFTYRGPDTTKTITLNLEGTVSGGFGGFASGPSIRGGMNISDADSIETSTPIIQLAPTLSLTIAAPDLAADLSETKSLSDSVTINPVDGQQFYISTSLTAVANDFGTATSLNSLRANFDDPSGLVAASTSTGTPNDPPVADVGMSQTVLPGDTVSLDASASSDPNGNLPLTYAWQLTEVPVGSTATLSDTTLVNPEFVADKNGDYVLQLVVTDSLGLASAPATVTISTLNTAPVAEAGPDQAITQTGEQVLLDGSQSYDDDGDSWTALWSFTAVPEGSNASLSDATSLTPSFVAGTKGDYVLQLVVTDAFGAASAADSVAATFANVAPVANAGNNQTGNIGDVITLNGNGSVDANGDALSYSWTFTAKPEGSNATLSNATAAQASFTADVAGSYTVSLLVNDGSASSAPSTATVLVVGDAASDVVTDLQELVAVVNKIKRRKFWHPDHKRIFTKRLNKVIALVERGIATGKRRPIKRARAKINNGLLRRTNGCARVGHPDRNDWIIRCRPQNKVYAPLIEIRKKLRSML